MHLSKGGLFLSWKHFSLLILHQIQLQLSSGFPVVSSVRSLTILYYSAITCIVLKIENFDQVTFLLYVISLLFKFKSKFLIWEWKWFAAWSLHSLLPLFTTHLHSCHSEFFTIPGKVRSFCMMLPLLTMSFPQIHLGNCSSFSSLTLTSIDRFTYLCPSPVMSSYSSLILESPASQKGWFP